jgi:hypothetical protein
MALVSRIRLAAFDSTVAARRESSRLRHPYFKKLHANARNFSQTALHDHRLPIKTSLEIILEIRNCRQVAFRLRSVGFPKKGLFEGDAG